MMGVSDFAPTISSLLHPPVSNPDISAKSRNKILKELLHAGECRSNGLFQIYGWKVGEAKNTPAWRSVTLVDVGGISVLLSDLPTVLWDAYTTVLMKMDIHSPTEPRRSKARKKVAFENYYLLVSARTTAANG